MSRLRGACRGGFAHPAVGWEAFLPSLLCPVVLCDFLNRGVSHAALRSFVSQFSLCPLHTSPAFLPASPPMHTALPFPFWGFSCSVPAGIDVLSQGGLRPVRASQLCPEVETSSLLACQCQLLFSWECHADCSHLSASVGMGDLGPFACPYEAAAKCLQR